MNIRTQYLEHVFEVLLVVGYIFFIFVASYIRGPVYILYSSEVSYILLFNGVNLLMGEPVQFVAHSLPLLEIGALISLALHVLQGGFSLAESVAHNAETFSIALDIVIFVFVGWGLLRFYRRLVSLFGLLPGVMGLLPLLFPASGYCVILHATPEIFILGCAFWALEFCLRTEGSQPSESKTRNAVIVGIFVAVGLATKVVFLPVLLVTFVMVPRRVPFILGLVSTLVVLYLPILDELGSFFNYFAPGKGGAWTGTSISAKGLSGWPEGFLSLVKSIPLYVCTIAVVFILGVVRWKVISSKMVQNKWLYVSLAGCLFALVFVAIRPHPWYLTSSFPLLGIGLAMCFSQRGFSRHRYPVLVGLAGGLWMLAVLWFTHSFYGFWNMNLKGQAKAEIGLVESRSHCAIILQVAAAHPMAAIFHGMNYTRGLLWDKIGASVIPKRYYWHFLEHPETLFNHVGKEISASQVLGNYDCALVTGVSLQDGLRPNHAAAPRTFSVGTYCPLAGPTFGYNCNVPSMWNNSLGYVKSHEVRPSVSVLNAPQSAVSPIPSDFLIDANINTFWETNVSGTTVIDLKINPATYTNSYSLAVGGHDSAAVLVVPKSWRLYARNSAGEDWTILDSISDTKDWSLNEQRRFKLDTKKTYSEFRFEFDPLPNQKIIRIYEISFGFEGDVQMQHPDENLKVD